MIGHLYLLIILLWACLVLILALDFIGLGSALLPGLGARTNKHCIPSTNHHMWIVFFVLSLFICSWAFSIDLDENRVLLDSCAYLKPWHNSNRPGLSNNFVLPCVHVGSTQIFTGFMCFLFRIMVQLKLPWPFKWFCPPVCLLRMNTALKFLLVTCACYLEPWYNSNCHGLSNDFVLLCVGSTQHFNVSLINGFLFGK